MLVVIADDAKIAVLLGQRLTNLNWAALVSGIVTST
jgi:hypothetical protein